MAVRPLYNGAARVGADNNAADPALLVRYLFRAQVGVTPDPATEAVANQIFEVEAGSGIPIVYDIRKFGGGVATGQPDDAIIRIFNDDDNNDARAEAVAEFDVLTGALPAGGTTGTVFFTPVTSGTFRIQLEIQFGAGNFGATSTNWRAFSDGGFQFGGATAINALRYADKGRLRSGTRINSVAVTDRGLTTPAIFAYTGVEAVRIEVTTAHGANKPAANLRVRQRRNETVTIDHDLNTVQQTPTVQRTETIINDISYPATEVLYDVVVVTTNSALHANNTRQYDALGGQAASGAWLHFVGVGVGLTLVDYSTVERIAAYIVDARGIVTHHFQVEDDVFGLTKHEPSNSMADDESAFLWSIIKNARGEGLNGLGVTQSLDPVRPGDSISAASVTSIQDAQAGVSGLLRWTAAKPTGTWDKVVDITTPNTIDADSYLFDNIQSYVMRKIVTDYVILGGGGPVDKARHFTAGQPFQAGLQVINIKTAHRQPLDTDAEGAMAYVALVRLQDSGPNAGLGEFLDENNVWQPLPVGATVDISFFRVVETTPGSGVFIRIWTAEQTAEWGDYDIFVVAKVRINQNWYGNYMQAQVLGPFNDHGTESPVLAQDIEAIANAVWNEPTGEPRSVSSYGALVNTNLDATVSSRATPADVSGGGGGSGTVVSGEVGP